MASKPRKPKKDEASYPPLARFNSGPKKEPPPSWQEVEAKRKAEERWWAERGAAMRETGR